MLSSIGESVSCLEPGVKKIPYSIEAQTYAFDITTKQPQLFVCRDFQHLKDVLEEFASTMAFKIGGLEGINKAIECNNVTTCEYSSGLQVSGVFTEVVTDENNSPIYLRTTGKTALAFRDKELAGHGIDHHSDGFGSPIGKWKQTTTSPELLTNDQLHALGIVEGRKAKIEFLGGVIVSGKVEGILRRDGKLVLITFSNCTTKHGDRVLFDPEWGVFDMAVGERISSVFNAAADKAKEWGVNINYSAYSPRRTGCRDYFLTTPEQLDTLRREFARLKTRINSRWVTNSITTLDATQKYFETGGTPGCKAGLRWLVVTCDGKLQPCSMQFKRYALEERSRMIEEFTATNACDQCYVSIRSYLDKSFPVLLWENVSGFFSFKPQKQSV